MIALNQLALAILAGGKGRRMGGDTKPLLKLGNKLLIQHVIDKAKAQILASATISDTWPITVQNLVINANDNLSQYEALGLPIQVDIIPDYAGPLAGVLSSMTWALKHQPQVRHILTIAADTPFFPDDYVEKMCSAIVDKNLESKLKKLNKGEVLAVANYQGRSQPVFGLWPVSLKSDLHKAIVNEGVHKVDAFTNRYRVAQVAFEDNKLAPLDPFFNINRPADLGQAEIILRDRHS